MGVAWCGGLIGILDEGSGIRGIVERGFGWQLSSSEPLIGNPSLIEVIAAFLGIELAPLVDTACAAVGIDSEFACAQILHPSGSLRLWPTWV